VRLRDRPAPAAPDSAAVRTGGGSRPVVLATLAVPFDADSYWVALDAARESGVPLIVVDAVELPLWPQSIATGHADVELEADRACIREFVEQATGLGLEVEHLRVRSPRPVDALLEVAGERQAGLLVFGPDRSRLRPRRFARVVRRIRKRASCLLWVAGEGP
jgi:nucleotide-binding universal stress UspA family protein